MSHLQRRRIVRNQHRQREKRLRCPGLASPKNTKFSFVANGHPFDTNWGKRKSANCRARLVIRFKTGADNGNVHVTNQLLGFRSEYQQRNEAGTELRAGADILFENLGQKVDTNDSSVSISNS